MVKRNKPDFGPGFDIEAARTTLVDCLVEHDEFMDQELRRRIADYAAAQDKSLKAGWDLAFSATMPHLSLHGIPCQVRVDGEWQEAPRCPRTRCKAAAVVLALHALYEYRRERGRPAKEARAVSAVADGLLALDLSAMEELARASLKKFEPLKGVLRPEYLGSLRHYERCVQLAARLRECEKEARELQPIFQACLSSRELRNVVPKRGRPKRWLLTVVRQHLSWGGFSPSEIAEMIPEGPLKTAAQRLAAVRSVRRAIATLDGRRMRAWEPELAAK